MRFSPHLFMGGTVAALLVFTPYAYAFAPEQLAATAARSVAAGAVPAPVASVSAPVSAQVSAQIWAPVAPDAIVPGLGAAAAEGLLDSARGGAGGSGASADLRGVVTGNSATSVVTGSNTIQASSFAGASGIPIVIQNTGANVLIQNATVINLQFQ